MCLIVISFNPSTELKLLALANRDEFYERPSLQAHFWKDQEGVLAGRDEQAGGTWFGVHASGRFAAVTNYREPGVVVEGALSRGNLVSDFLNGDQSAGAYMKTIELNADRYNGFNLLAFDTENLFYFSNRSGAPPSRLPKGTYGLSNHLLDTPWPKVVKLKKRFGEACDKAKNADEIWSNSSFLDLITDESVAKDIDLPETGVPLDWERTLSAMLIKSEQYGTRCSTMVSVTKSNQIRFAEKTIHPTNIGQPLVQFEIQPTIGHPHSHL